MAFKKYTIKLLGQPLHTMLIPLPRGLLGTALLFDLIAANPTRWSRAA
jgi:uncharacterized membrane protein